MVCPCADHEDAVLDNSLFRPSIFCLPARNGSHHTKVPRPGLEYSYQTWPAHINPLPVLTGTRIRGMKGQQNRRKGPPLRVQDGRDRDKTRRVSIVAVGIREGSRREEGLTY